MKYFLTSTCYRMDGTVEHDPFKGTQDDIIGEYTDIYHTCPHCSGVASESRSLIYLIKKCIKEGKCVYPCRSCGKPFTVPMAIWNSEGIEKLRNSNLDRIPFDKIKLGELFIKNWEQTLMDANSEVDTQESLIAYDGKGPCPGCACSSSTPKIQIKLNCPGCEQDLWVDESIGNADTNAIAVCSGCKKKLTVPDKAWCSVCKIHFLPETVVKKEFLKANKNIKSTSNAAAVSDNKNGSVVKKWWQFWKDQQFF